eukprot:COSAG05_NODE_142_length_16591_cov_6.726837_15_plen_91_part_00
MTCLIVRWVALDLVAGGDVCRGGGVLIGKHAEVAPLAVDTDLSPPLAISFHLPFPVHAAVLRRKLRLAMARGREVEHRPVGLLPTVAKER